MPGDRRWERGSLIFLSLPLLDSLQLPLVHPRPASRRPQHLGENQGQLQRPRSTCPGHAHFPRGHAALQRTQAAHPVLVEGDLPRPSAVAAPSDTVVRGVPVSAWLAHAPGSHRAPGAAAPTRRRSTLRPPLPLLLPKTHGLV